MDPGSDPVCYAVAGGCCCSGFSELSGGNAAGDDRHDCSSRCCGLPFISVLAYGSGAGRSSAAECRTGYGTLQGNETEGHKFDLFVFDLSYLGWNILSLLTGGILSVLYVAPYKMMATAFVYEEMKGRPVMVDDIKPSTDGNGMTIAVDPKKLMGIGSTGGKKPTSHIPAASRAAGAALEGVAGMYAGSSYPLEPNQPVILGRDPVYAKIVFSQGAQKISRRHCEVMFNSQVQKYRVTDFSSNGTYVNGSRLPANSPVLLTRGTELALGDNNNIIRLS